MTRAEYRYVDEIPEMEPWWTHDLIDPGHPPERCPHRTAKKPDVHYEKCEVPTDKYTVTCVFSAGHRGDEHAALVGVFRDISKEPYLYWRPGVPGGREIRQPGVCVRLDDSEPTGEVFCVLPTDHPGDCLPNM